MDDAYADYHFYPAKRIPPYNLWVGSQRDSMNATAARRHNIGLVVNCTRDIPFAVPGVSHYRVPVDDRPDDSADMLKHLAAATAMIDDFISSGKGVLVHCFAGVSRSASVTAAFLMLREGLTHRQAMARVKAAKPETFGDSPNFEVALKVFEGTLMERRRGTAASTPRGRAGQ